MMRPRYLRGDFLLVAAGAVCAGTFAVWISYRGVRGIYAMLGFMAVLWVLLDVLLRRITKEQHEDDKRYRVQRPKSPHGETILWPPLPTDDMVRGQPATREDVAKGRAAFVMHDVSGRPGVAVNIELPQYGIVESTPVFVIQAESD